MHRVAPVIAFAIVAACDRPSRPGPAAAPAAPAPAVVRDAIESLSQHFRVYVLNSDARGVASLFTFEGRLEMHGLPSLVGARVIAERLATEFASAKHRTWDFTFREVQSVSTDVVTARGAIHTVTQVKGEARNRWLRWSATYRRMADGYYHIEYLMAFPDSTR